MLSLVEHHPKSVRAGIPIEAAPQANTAPLLRLNGLARTIPCFPSPSRSTHWRTRKPGRQFLTRYVL